MTERKLTADKGIPSGVIFMMAALSALTVANLYYNQPLLEMIRSDLGITQVQANLITVITQAGYALGLLFVIPVADMVPSRKIMVSTMVVAGISALIIAFARNAATVWAASLTLGICSITPQLFLPVASRFSRPEHKSRNMGYVASGIMVGILSARVLSGYVGSSLGWRSMFLIAVALMVLCLAISLLFMPGMEPTFKGKFSSLMKTVWGIFRGNPKIRAYSFRAGLCFGSMLSIWSCMAFHLAGYPFYAGSEKVGLLGLCGIAGAVAVSGVGRIIPKVGIPRMSVIGALIQLLGWATAFFFGYSYAGLVAAIILCDIGAQCLQLSNQSGSLAQIPEASNRVNTIFMTTLFLGGSLGSFISGQGWNIGGWSGVCAVGALFTLCSLGVTLYAKMKGMDSWTSLHNNS